jgi:beta-glucosidase-like glycosyl hydrolase
MIRYLNFILFSLFSTSLLSQSSLVTKDYENQKIWVDSVYSSLTIDQKIGQLFTIWVATKEGPERMDEIADIIKTNHLGGLIFSLGNVKDQAIATNRFQSISKVPLLIGMDAEWGIGMRLDDAFSFPFNMTLGAIENNKLIYEVGERIGVHSKRLGVHINFAPVVDINTNPNNPVIGSRSFGENKFNVTNKSIAYLKGMQSQGIMGSAKHFPGHGDTSKDSHKTLPTINFDSKRINDVELYPFKELIKNNLSSVMVAHMEVPSLEKKPKLPSTLSKTIVTKILKKKLKFDGLIITDAMDMKGVVDFNKSESADVAALLAGNDLLLMPDDLDQSTLSIKKALNEGVLTTQRLSQSVKKILMAKYKAGLNNNSTVTLENLREDLNSEKDKALLDQLTKESITVIKNESQIVPIKNLSKKIAYLKMGDSDSDEFFKMLNHYTKVDLIDSNSDFLRLIDGYDHIIVGLHKSDETPFESYKFTSTEKSNLELISKSSKVILTVFSKPYALMDIDLTNISSIIVPYQNNAVTQQKTAQLIFGAIGSKGVLPVSINKSFPAGTSIKTTPLKRLSYSHPNNQGFDIKKLNKIDSIVRFAIDEKMTPGAQILVARNGEVVYNKSFGTKTYHSKNNIEWDDIYDLASLTKILSTVPLMMEEYENENITLETTLSKMFPNKNLNDKSDLSIKEMFSHQSGLFPWIPFYKNTIDSITKKPLDSWYRTKKSSDFTIKVNENLFLREDFLDSIALDINNSELFENKSYVYSDLPYYYMKSFLEDKNNLNLDVQLKKKFSSH